jgi:hypothetical protein
LVLLGRVDSPKPIRHAIDPERVAIDYADGLRKGWKGRKREDSGQNRQFHRFWLAGDYGDKAATASVVWHADGLSPGTYTAVPGGRASIPIGRGK